MKRDVGWSLQYVQNQTHVVTKMFLNKKFYRMKF